jgi:phospholipase C
VDLAVDPPSSTLSGEAFLERVFNAYRSATSNSGTNVWNTALLIGWDEPGGTYDHVPPGPAPPPDPAAGPGECGFTFDRSGYRVPAIIVSPWVESGTVYDDEYRHTSLIATLRKVWSLGDPFSGRDAAARTFDHVFSCARPRDPGEWVAVEAQPVPEWTMDLDEVGKGLSNLGITIGPGLIGKARELGLELSAEQNDQGSPPPRHVVETLRQIAGHFFPRLAPDRKN